MSSDLLHDMAAGGGGGGGHGLALHDEGGVIDELRAGGGGGGHFGGKAGSVCCRFSAGILGGKADTKKLKTKTKIFFLNTVNLNFV